MCVSLCLRADFLEMEADIPGARGSHGRKMARIGTLTKAKIHKILFSREVAECLSRNRKQLESPTFLSRHQGCGPWWGSQSPHFVQKQPFSRDKSILNNE